MSEERYAVTLENKLKAFTLSPAAAHWVAKALHPVTGGPSQIPDAIQVDTVVPEYKNTTVIGAPATLPANTNWDLYILLPPSDSTSALWAAAPAGTNFGTASYSPGGTTGVIASGVVETATSTPMTPFNAFPVSAAVSGTPALGARASFQSTVSSELPAAWRTTARSATLYATGSDLYNQGTIYAGQYARRVRPGPFGAVQTRSASAPWVNFWAFNQDYVDLPVDEATMALLTPNLYTASARDGVYSVHRLTGPDQEFARARNLTSFIDTSKTALFFSAYDPAGDDGNASHQVRICFGPSNQPSALFGGIVGTADANQQSGSTGFDDRCSWGVIICRGLHPLMTVTLKTVVNLELIPTDASPTRQFVRPSLKYEPTAMAAYYAIASEAPSCMAAKHNFLGTLLPILSSVASRVLPFLAPLAGQFLSGAGQQLVSSFAPSGGGEQQPPKPLVRNTNVLRAPRLRPRAASVASTQSRRSVKVKIARRKRK